MPTAAPTFKCCSDVIRMKVISNPGESTDYVVCRPPGGNSDGSDDVNVAKPENLRTRPDSSMKMDPPYLSGSTAPYNSTYPDPHYIWVAKKPKGGTGSTNAPDYQDLNVEGRAWSWVHPVCISGANKSQNFKASIPY